MKVVWSEQARLELVEHYRFYVSRNPDAARHIRAAIMEAARRLHDHPRMGRPGRVEGTRELVIVGTAFLLVYDESPARVEILHVYHGRQNWQSEE
jgi:plasmid stabilization system protein ParE